MDPAISSLIDRAGLDRGKVRQLVGHGLEGADDGELFLEYRQAEVLAARERLIAPVSAIASRTSSLRLRAPARLCVGASREGAWTMPASIADCARLRFSGSRPK